MTKTEILSITQKEEIIFIWNAEYPKTLRYSDIGPFEAYLAKMGKPIHYIKSDEKGQLIGWLATFDRDDERWFVMLVDARYQGRGIGSQMLDAAKKDESVLNGWAADHNKDMKADGTIYRTPITFYLKNGFEVLSDIRFEDGNLSLVKIRWKGAE